MAIERSFIAIKHEGCQAGLVGEIIRRFERKVFTLVGLKQLVPSRVLAEQHYGVHNDLPIFPELVEFITSGLVVRIVLEGGGCYSGAQN